MIKFLIQKSGKYLISGYLILTVFVTCVHAQHQIIIDRYRQYLVRTATEKDSTVESWGKTLQADGRWPDIYYEDKEPAAWKTPDHLKRVQAMALLLNTQGSKFFQNPQLFNKITLALDHWLIKRYQNSNWWHNEIGVPQYMRDIVVLLQGKLDSGRFAQSLGVIRQFKIKEQFTGGNLIWCTDLGIHYGALTGDEQLIDYSRGLMIKELTTGNAEGIQADYSFLQHGNRLQMFHYGHTYLWEGLRLSWQLRNTAFAVPADKVALLLDVVLNGWQWMARGIYTVPGTIDRAVSRKGGLKLANLRPLIPFMIELYPAKEAELKKFGAVQDQKDFLLGYRYFPKSDFAAYQRPAFSFFLKTISSRTLPSESINRENLKGRLLNAGDAYLVRDGSEYTDLMPVMDWSALPGVTSFKNAFEIERNGFTGSVSNGQTGMTAMHYLMKDSTGRQTISARKFWACYKDFVVCLIGGMDVSNIADPVFTALNQCRLDGEVYTSSGTAAIRGGSHDFRNLKWIYHSGIAYIPLAEDAITVRLEDMTGSWYDINRSGSKMQLTEKVFMPVMIHKPGKNVSTGYVLSQCATAAEAQHIASRPQWTVLANDRHVQATEMNDGTLMAAFHSPGKLRFSKGQEIKVNQPCLILISEGKLYMSDPSHKGIMVTVTIHNQIQQVSLPHDGSSVSVDYL